jgi:hypothetical protein
MAPLILALALAGNAADAPKFTYRLKKAEDAVTATVGSDSATFTVMSKSGIGAGEIILAEGSWPRQVTLEMDRLQYLEHFVVGNDIVKLSGTLRTRPRTVWHYDRRGNRVDDPAKAVYTMTVLEQKGSIQVVLPPGFATKDTKKLELDWIDAFRR